MFDKILLNPLLRVYFELGLFLYVHIYLAYELIFNFNSISLAQVAISIFIGFLLLLLGQDIGAHRLFSHASFVPSRGLKNLLLFLIAIANYGSALDWIISHLTHHKFSDGKNDPTNPETVGALALFSDIWKLKALYNSPPEVLSFQNRTYISFSKDKDVIFFHKYHMLIIVLWAALLLWFGGQSAVLYYFGIPSLYCAYVLNFISYGNHKFGKIEQEKNKSTNFLMVNLFLPGAGWHANHHQDPSNYRFNTKYDLGGFVIETYNKLKR